MQPLSLSSPALSVLKVEGAASAIMPERNRTSSPPPWTPTSPTKSRASHDSGRTSSTIARLAVSFGHSSHILTAEELRLSPQILQLCELSKGLVLVTGRPGREVDDALRHDRLHQPHALRQCDHDRGSDRVRPSEQAVASSTTRRCTHHTARSRTPCEQRSAGSRHRLVGELRDLETVALPSRRPRQGTCVRHAPHVDSRIHGRPGHRSVPPIVRARSASCSPSH